MAYTWTRYTSFLFTSMHVQILAENSVESVTITS